VKILYALAPGDPSSIGGIQSYQRELMEGMRSRGHRLQSVAFLPEEILSSPRDRLPRWPYLHPQYFWRKSYYQDYRYHQWVQRRVKEAVERFRPDLVHVFHLHQLGALRASAAPSVVSCHGMEVGPTRLVRDSLRSATGVHCNSSFTCGLVEAVQPGLRLKKVIRWGVRRRQVEPVPVSYDLITVSRLVERKNLVTVLRALQSRPHLRYAIVGDGPQRAELERVSRELGLSGVEFMGEVDEDRKWRLLASSRAFILPPRKDLGRDVEGLGLCFYEAYAVGLPVIGALSGGVGEAVGGAGLAVEDALDPEEIGRAIDRVLDPATYGIWRQRVRERMERENWGRFLDEFEEFYRQLIAR